VLRRRQKIYPKATDVIRVASDVWPRRLYCWSLKMSSNLL